MTTPEARPADAPRRSRGGLQARIFLTFGIIVVGLVTAAVTFFVRSESDSLLRETKKRGAAEFVSKGSDITVLLNAIRRAPQQASPQQAS